MSLIRDGLRRIYGPLGPQQKAQQEAIALIIQSQLKDELITAEWSEWLEIALSCAAHRTTAGTYEGRDSGGSWAVKLVSA